MCPFYLFAQTWPEHKVQFLKTTSHLKPLIEFWPNFTGMTTRWSSTKVVQTVPVDCISRSRGQKCNFQKSSYLKLQGPELSYLVYSIIKMYQSCSNYAPEVKIGGHNFTLNYIRKTSNDFLLNRLWEFYQTQQEWSLGGPLPKLFKLFKWFWLVA